MSKTVVVQPETELSVGTSFHVYSNHLKVGDSVDICRSLGRHVGKPIASGEVVANGTDDPRAQVYHPQNGNANA